MAGNAILLLKPQARREFARKVTHRMRALCAFQLFLLLLVVPPSTSFLIRQESSPRKQPFGLLATSSLNPHPEDSTNKEAATILLQKLTSIVQPKEDHATLPIHDILSDLSQSIEAKRNILLEAPPGAGKTTIVPLAMLHHHFENSHDYQIWMVEPRRIAARSAANRMAALLGENVGTTVGYRIRGESRISSSTKITVVTDGILLQRLRSDPELKGIDMIIFDEFHERGVDSDVALALCRQVQQIWRDDTTTTLPLKMIAMSATLLGDLDVVGDATESSSSCSPATKLVRSLGGSDECNILKSNGRQYPITIYHANDLTWSQVRPLPLRILQRDRNELVNVMCDAIQQGLNRAPAKGDVLAFLPGASEIRRTVQQLATCLPKDVEVVPLYGALTKDQQDYALFPQTQRRRVVVSSPIAEASLTLERITCVVDSGLRREPRCDVDTNLPRLVTTLCSKASATQRAGRAGRVQEGLCLRIYTESEMESSFVEQSNPEILSTDLTSTVLLLVAWGCSCREEILEDIPFVDSPPIESLDSAIRLLVDLGALTDIKGRLATTSFGNEIVEIPMHPRFATVIQHARRNDSGLTALAAAIAVTFLLDDDTGIRFYNNKDPDLVARVCDLYERIKINENSALRNAIYQYAARIGNDAKTVVQKVMDGHIPVLDIGATVGPTLLPGFIDLVGERKGDASYGGSMYLLSLGRSARIDDYDSGSPAYIVVVETSTSDDGKTRVRAFASIDKELLLQRSMESEVVFTVPSRGYEVRAKKVRSVGSLELDSMPLPFPSSEKAVEILKETIANLGGYYLALTQTMSPEKRGQLHELCRRVHWASKLDEVTDTPWPVCMSVLMKSIDGIPTDREDEKVLEVLIEPWLAAAGSLKKVDLLEIVTNTLSQEQQLRLQRDYPVHIPAPDGSLIPISYSTDPPSATAKLQQFFGTCESPMIGPSHNPMRISLSLVSPAGKVVAQTVDLNFFWTQVYPQVRAELRGRYAKHPWPEDPMTAVATRQTKKQLIAMEANQASQSSGAAPVSDSKKKRRKGK